jgi:hypothetical protein
MRQRFPSDSDNEKRRGARPKAYPRVFRQRMNSVPPARHAPRLSRRWAFGRNGKPTHSAVNRVASRFPIGPRPCADILSCACHSAATATATLMARLPDFNGLGLDAFDDYRAWNALPLGRGRAATNASALARKQEKAGAVWALARLRPDLAPAIGADVAFDLLASIRCYEQAAIGAILVTLR